MPRSLQSDNGPAFISGMTQGISEALQISYYLHLAPSGIRQGRKSQSSPQEISKLAIETHQTWVTLLAIALLRVQITPKARPHIRPYEICGRSFLSTDLLGDPETRYLVQYLPTLGLTLKNIWEYQDQNSPKPDPNFSETAPHLHPGEWVYVKNLPQEWRPLEAVWTGPYKAPLATPTAAKIQGFTLWIHMS